jgi:signal peptidase I
MKNEGHNVIKELGFSLLDEGKTLRIRAEGYSMFPVIKPGNFIFVEPVTDLVAGDIIAWKRETGFVVHRLIRVISRDDQLFYITRGDSCANEDTPVMKSQVAGKVIYIEKLSGYRRPVKNRLISKFDYIYNRFLVWLLLRFRRVLKIIRN